MQAKINLLRLCGAIEAADGVSDAVKTYWRNLRIRASGFDIGDIFK